MDGTASTPAAPRATARFEEGELLADRGSRHPAAHRGSPARCGSGTRSRSIPRWAGTGRSTTQASGLRRARHVRPRSLDVRDAPAPARYGDSFDSRARAAARLCARTDSALAGGQPALHAAGRPVEQQRLRELDLDNVTRDDADRRRRRRGFTAGVDNRCTGAARASARHAALRRRRRSRGSTTSRTTSFTGLLIDGSRVPVRAHHDCASTWASIQRRASTRRGAARGAQAVRGRPPRGLALSLPAPRSRASSRTSATRRALRRRADRCRSREIRSMATVALLDHARAGPSPTGLPTRSRRVAARAIAGGDRIPLEAVDAGRSGVEIAQDRAARRQFNYAIACSAARRRSRGSSRSRCRASACLTASEPFDNNLKWRSLSSRRAGRRGPSEAAGCFARPRNSSRSSPSGATWSRVVREILADMDTPLSLFRRLDDGQHQLPVRVGRGRREVGALQLHRHAARARCSARAAARSSGARAGARNASALTGDPLEMLREKLAALRAGGARRACTLPRFLGGAVGAGGLRLGALRRARARREPRRDRHSRTSGSCCRRRWSSYDNVRQSRAADPRT